ncbi:MAG TPA: di-heme oxidoredictase family protein, partial [Bryobacteraceae bacterium]|nr:di-heme oxidoredictase family protein [Bryobacteraceae bacterium]
MMFTTGASRRFAILTVSLTSLCLAQKDPGVRSGPPGAGGPIAGLQVNELALFYEGRARTVQLESVCDTCNDVTLGAETGEDPNLVTLTNSSGLGARFNGDQCSVCHQQPAIGGSGGFLVPNPQDPPLKRRPPENPMFDLIPHRKGGQNYVPSFITRYGPIREVRFQRKPDGTPDGGVHQLFTIAGRFDIGATGCTAAVLPQPDFETEYRNGNLSFRIPLQMFGLGLMEAIQDQTILSNSASTASLRTPLGIAGIPNRSGNDGTITRFGWKAQNKSLVIFAGEAYNVEMGVTNDVFPTRMDETHACGQQVNEPNDITRVDTNDERNQGFNNPLHILPDWLGFAIFMRALAPPQPVAFSESASRGQQLFGTGVDNPGIGCFLCHTPMMVTSPQHDTEALESVPAHLYSDLLIHHMGSGLADNVTQGLAQGDMFRTTPLWGVGQRMFFLHDGRTSDLLVAIQAHASTDSEESRDSGKSVGGYPASEATAVVRKFN